MPPTPKKRAREAGEGGGRCGGGAPESSVGAMKGAPVPPIPGPI